MREWCAAIVWISSHTAHGGWRGSAQHGSARHARGDVGGGHDSRRGRDVGFVGACDFGCAE